jgi:ribose transport system substrate-binding protein
MKRMFAIAAIGVSALFMGVRGLTAQTDNSKPLTLAFVTNNSSAYWIKARQGCDQAVKELTNVKVDFRIPSDASAAGQKQIVQDLLARKIDGIAISPIDPANQTPMLNDASGQTLLVTQDSDAAKSKRVFYLGSDNTAAGRQAGEQIKKALPNGGKIMVFVGDKDAQNAKDREGGVEEVLKGSNITVVDIRTDNTDKARAKSNVQDTLVTHPEVTCLVGLWSYNGPAIISAVREAKKVGQVQIVCFDDENETIQAVKAGEIFATIAQQPFEIGRQSVIDMAKYLRGDTSFVPADKRIIIPTMALNKDNVAEFVAKFDKAQ